MSREGKAPLKTAGLFHSRDRESVRRATVLRENGFTEGISRGSEEKKNRWQAEKLEATRETWALRGSFAFGSG